MYTSLIEITDCRLMLACAWSAHNLKLDCYNLDLTLESLTAGQQLKPERSTSRNWWYTCWAEHAVNSTWFQQLDDVGWKKSGPHILTRSCIFAIVTLLCGHIWCMWADCYTETEGQSMWLCLAGHWLQSELHDTLCSISTSIETLQNCTAQLCWASGQHLQCKHSSNSHSHSRHNGQRRHVDSSTGACLGWVGCDLKHISISCKCTKEQSASVPSAVQMWPRGNLT